MLPGFVRFGFAVGGLRIKFALQRLRIATTRTIITFVDEYWDRLAYGQTSIDECENEPIHRIGAIQSCAALLVIDAKTEKVIGHSDNLSEFVAVVDVLGKPLSSLPLAPADIDLSSFLARRVADEPQVFELVDSSTAKRLQARVHRRENHIFCELEQPHVAIGTPDQFLREIPSSLRRTFDGELLARGLHEASATLRKYLDYDRVMIYRFEPNGDGHVVAEAMTGGLEPFKGLRYPASDIPQQARQIFFECDSRIIVDTAALPSPIRSHKDAAANLDLSTVTYRASSPFHIEYLKNMGVSASFTVPIKQGEGLWGLIACHNYRSARHLSAQERMNAELFGRLLSGHLQDVAQLRLLHMERLALALSRKLIDRVSSGADVIEAFADSHPDLLEMVAADGMAVKWGNDKASFGVVPEREISEKVVDKLQQRHELEPFATDSMRELDIAPTQTLGGLLAVPLSMGYQSYLIWYRQPAEQTIQWAGQPPASDGAAKTRLSPRGSFGLWEQTIVDKSLEWSDEQFDAARLLLYAFIGDVFEKASSLAAANQRLKEASEAKDAFVSTVSHELRTPLNVIIGWVQILKRAKGLPEGARQAIETIDRNAAAQLTLINDLLDATRIRAGKIRLRIKPQVELHTLVREVIHDLRPSADAKSIQLTTQLDEVTSSVDPERMRQVIWNLVSNAIKFTPKRGHVQVTLRFVGSDIVMKVIDDGLGITEEELPRVFDQFAQARAGKKRTSGLGLGLTIVKTLTMLHGGEIVAESEGRGQGATFTTRFPAVGAAPAEEVAHADASFIQHGTQLQGFRILVVEDEPDASAALSFFLRAEGAFVIEAENGREAFDVYTNDAKGFTMVLSDIGMPEWDGLRLIEEIRQRETSEEKKPIPAIALTAYATPKDRIACLEAGFSSYIAKPVDHTELLAVIRSIL